MMMMSSSVSLSDHICRVMRYWTFLSNWRTTSVSLLLLLLLLVVVIIITGFEAEVVEGKRN